MRIFEPNRAIYRSRKKKKDFCDFCDADTLQDQEVKQLRSDFWSVLACKYPYMDGNLMIIPKRHVCELDHLNKEEWEDFTKVLLTSKKLLAKLFKTKSFNITMQIGPYSGGSMSHLHWMIIPRPKLQNISAWNAVHDFYLVTLSYKDLIKKIDEYYKTGNVERRTLKV
ncbi:MAG: DUF4931 domain-containing protein [Patescibacteria group bacterium]